MTLKESTSAARAENSLKLVSIDLMAEVARLKQIPRWTSEDRHAASLVKMGALNILLLTLKKDAELTEHRACGPINVYVLVGSIRFTAGGDQLTLAAGSMVALDRDIAHSVQALEETSLIVTTAIT